MEKERAEDMALYHFNEEGFDKALASGKLMMVDFWASWCGPCQRLGPVVEAIAEDYEGQDVVFGKVDVDENASLAGRYGVENIPTVIFFKNGSELDRRVGAMDAGAYEQVLDANL